MTMGFNVVQLGAELASPPFARHLVETSVFTLDSDLEAGFAVYRDSDGTVTYSDVLHPDDEYLEAVAILEARAARMDPQERIPYLLQLMEGGADPEGILPTLSLGRLITDDQVNLRTDLAVIAHSHPLTHLGRRRPATRLFPSVKDLINYGDHLASNPGLVESVTVTHQDLGGIALLLWRATQDDSLQRLQALEPGDNATKELMEKLGLRTATVIFDRGDGRVLKGLETIENLYV